MPSRFDLNDDLEALERELGPALRGALRGDAARPEFAARLRSELDSLPSQTNQTRLRLLPGRAWAALAAILVVGLVSSTALFAARAQTASAEEVLSQVQAEAVTMLSTNATPCGGPKGDGGAGIAVFQGSGGEPVSAGKPGGAVTIQNGQVGSPTDLSDKLAKALGVSGDRVRQAMVATMRSITPASLPPDPMTIIAQQLGMPEEQVCGAFFDPQSQFGGIVLHRGDGPDGPMAGTTTARDEQFNVRTGTSKPALDLNTATPQQLAATAQRLGVTPERLATAVHAAAEAPLPSPPAPPKEDQIINTFAQNLGMSPDKVRAAITEVEGPHLFYFAVPVPNR